MPEIHGRDGREWLALKSSIGFFLRHLESKKGGCLDHLYSICLVSRVPRMNNLGCAIAMIDSALEHRYAMVKVSKMEMEKHENGGEKTIDGTMEKSTLKPLRKLIQGSTNSKTIEQNSEVMAHPALVTGASSQVDCSSNHRNGREDVSSLSFFPNSYSFSANTLLLCTYHIQHRTSTFLIGM